LVRDRLAVMISGTAEVTSLVQSLARYCMPHFSRIFTQKRTWPSSSSAWP
jgi:hypothetical protein